MKAQLNGLLVSLGSQGSWMKQESIKALQELLDQESPRSSKSYTEFSESEGEEEIEEEKKEEKKDEKKQKMMVEKEHEKEKEKDTGEVEEESWLEEQLLQDLSPPDCW